jgi:tetratricopeptide (TPR) repeat protein
LKNAFVIVTLCTGLSACTVMPFFQQEAAVSAPPAQAAEPAPPPAPAPAPAEAAAGAVTTPPADPIKAAIAELAAAPQQDQLPGVALSSDLFFQITSAEMEFKAGRWQSAYATLMRAAQQTRDPRIAQRAVEIALAVKQGPEALTAIRLWRELAPHSEEATQYFLGFMVLGDQMAEAEPVFAERLKNTPPAGRGIAMLQMQQFLSRAKDKAAALALLERVLAPYGEVPEAHLVLAQAAFAAADGARAKQEAQRALQLAPDSELALLTLAQVTPDAAADLVTTFLATHPGAREVRSAYVRMLIEQKRFAPAREQFRILLKDQPEHLGTLYALGIVSMQLDDNKAAEGYFKQFLAVLAAHPDEERDASKVLMILSQLAEERGDKAGALQWLDKVDESEPQAYFSARIRRAQLMAKHGDLDGARRSLTELKSEDAGEQGRVAQADAQLLRDAGQHAAALAALEAALKRFPDHIGLLYDFALEAERAQRFDQMEKSLRRVIELEPDNYQAYNALGYSLAERNVRLPEAQTLIGQALKMAPDDPFIIDSMAWVEFRLGHLEQAEEMLRRAYGLRADPDIAVHLGEVLWQKGDRAGAHKLWREARAKDPKNDTLKSTLARLNVHL